MSAQLVPPPFGAQPFDTKTNRFTETWQRWFLTIVNQIAAAFAPVDGSYVVTANVPGLVNQFDLGLLTDGILKQTVAAGVSTPAIAVAGTDYTALAFKTIAVATQSDVVADSPADTLTLVAGSGIAITTSPAGDSIEIAASGSSGITQLTGDVTAGPGSGSVAATIPNDTVTYAKMQNVSAASRVLGRGSASGSGDVQELTLGTGLSMSGTVLSATGAGQTGSITLTIDGQGVVITTGIKGYKYIPRACTIVAATIYSDNATPVTGSIVFDVWRDVQANYPPTVADTITASDKPTLTSGIFSQDTTLTGWSASLAVGDFLGFNVDSVSSLTKVVLELSVQY